MPGEGAGIPFGHYVLLRRIARGGMAEVFLARQRGFEGFDRRVAIKRILPHLADSPDFIKMFLGEAKLAAQLTHPNIVHIYEFGKVDSDYFIAMEYVDGVHAGQLFRYGAETEPLSPTLVARLGADAATALHHAHELRAPSGKPYGLVHRDVSPANLMVSFDGAVKLCDFGIAKAAALGDQLTNPGHVKGKYAYMSPEQTTATPLDGRSDVYSLAIVLWELIAGKTIVPRGDAAGAMRAIRDGKLTPIGRAAPWTPPALANAITWALQTRREHRPTAMQLAQELEAFIKSSPELATPMQLGAWLRVRFTREPTGEAGAQPSGGTQVAPSTLATPEAQPSRQGGPTGDHGIAASPGSPSVITSETTSETAVIAQPGDPADAATVLVAHRAAFEPTDPPTALRFDARAAASEPSEPPGAAMFDDPAAGEPIDPPGPASLLEDAETVMRSGAFRPLVPSGPAAAPTLLEPPRQLPSRPAAAPTLLEPRPLLPSRPAAVPMLLDPRPQVPSRSAAAPTLLDSHPRPVMRASPLGGVPTLRGVPPPPGRTATESVRSPPRRALALGGLIGLAVLSFVVALAARGTPPAVVPGNAAIGPAAPRDASPDAPPPSDAIAVDARPPTIAVDAAPPAIPLDAAATTILEIRTRPDGAMVTIAGQAHASPAQFTLPAGHYAITVELDGWMPEQRTVDLVGGERVVQDIVLATRLPHGHPPPPGRPR